MATTNFSQPEDAKAIDQKDQEKPRSGITRFLRFVLSRGSVIFLTILIGTYISVLVANKGGQVDAHIERKISQEFRVVRRTECQEETEAAQAACFDRTLENMREAAGLNLPASMRNVVFTFNSLIFNWGNANFIGTPSYYSQYADHSTVKDLILEHFPNTLLLFGVADLFIFIVGIPLALHISSRGREYWLDRIISVIVPLSSVPSWVHGVILVSIFSVTFRLLPYGGKYGVPPPGNVYELILTVSEHMLLPVTAILLSMFFHLVYTWRTYFIINSDEDYVDLGIAKGLSQRMLEQRYIRQPTMPYLLTSFALSLVGFWQMATALEYFFNWPGLGLLYVNAVPNFWGDAMYPGEMGIVLSIVVIFAYLLGMVVFLLDITYAWLDPRIRIASDDKKHQLTSRKRNWIAFLQFWKRTRRRVRVSAPRQKARTLQKSVIVEWIAGLRSFFGQSNGVLRQILRYPSATIGLALITVFVAGSIYAVVALPYAEMGATWHRESITGKVYMPNSVPPAWTNWFRENDIPETLILNSKEGDLVKTTRLEESGNQVIEFSVDIDYPYTDFPQDVVMYIDVTYTEKHPHMDLTWTTPDGRTVGLKSPSMVSDQTYSLSDGVVHQRITRKYPNIKEWLDLSIASVTPKHYLLFADPEATEPIAVSGTYQLKASVQTFEENTDVDFEFVMLGGVYGFAGTDQLGRDLTIPLFWGMPFTLAFGVLGAVGTTILSMILAATGVWIGGWADIVVQRISEANMILPILAIGILVFAMYGVEIWTVIIVIVLLGAFGSSTKAFRAAFLQVIESDYIESARAYGASDSRIIFQYMIPRVMPTLIPQFINMIPGLVFLEATLAIFNAFDPRYPTWGRVIYDAIRQGALWSGAAYRVLVPITLLLLIGLSFALLGFAVERIFNPRLQQMGE